MELVVSEQKNNWASPFLDFTKVHFFLLPFVLFAVKALQEYKPDTLTGANQLPFNLGVSKWYGLDLTQAIGMLMSVTWSTSCWKAPTPSVQRGDTVI